MAQRIFKVMAVFVINRYHWRQMAQSDRLEQQADRVKRWTLVATILGSSMVFINGATVNVALSTFQKSLGASVSDIQWILNAYTLLLASLILIGGSLGDHFGRKRLFLIGIVAFTLASIACGLAPTVETLILFRAAQGIGGALLTPASLAILSAAFPENERGKAIGLWSSFSALTSALGPVLGGFLIDNLSWRWIFFIHVPLAIAVVLIATRFVAESRDEAITRQVDWQGALLATLSLGMITYGLIASNSRTLGDPLVLTLIGIGLLIFIAFVWLQSHLDEPMVPLWLFKSRTFSGANGLTLLLYIGLNGIFFFLPLNLIQVQGYTATQTGAALLPMIALLALLGRWAGGLVDRVGAKLPLVIGPLIAAVGFLLFLRPSTEADYLTDFLPAIVTLGFGMAISVAPLTTAVMTAVPDHVAGTASGINNAVSRLAALLAITFLGIVMLNVFTSSLDDRLVAIRMETPEVADAIWADRADLAGIVLPSGISAEQSPILQATIDNAFVDGFRAVNALSALFAVASALVAATLIEGQTVS